MDRSDEPARIARFYRRFAEEEARGRSPLYESLALGAASDPEIIAFLMSLPGGKRQPNLLLAAIRLLFGTVHDYGDFRRRILANGERVRSLMLTRSTQTNEPGRCATLLPVLAMLPQPLALLEAGASAGLCLLPDCYGYDYGRQKLNAEGTASPRPVFPCAADHRTPLPSALPRIVWRAGLDLDPVDVSDPDQIAWLEALVWPEEVDRLARLRAALQIASARKPSVVKGDLLRDLAGLAAQAPRDATLVVFHTAVLVYVRSASERAGFARSVMSLCDFWIANEAAQIFPEIAERAGGTDRLGRYLISVNTQPVAWADFHGAWIDWIADPPSAHTAGTRE